MRLKLAYRYGQISPEAYQEELKARNAAWQALTRDQKIAILDMRLGKGVGAKRQRKMLEG